MKMIIEIEKLKHISKCDQDHCENIAIATVKYRNIFKHKFCLCKDCLNKLYKNIGKFITPKSPKNLMIKRLKEEDYE